jgi:hypothetical protein
MKTCFWLTLCFFTIGTLHAENPNFLLAWQTIALEVSGTNLEYQVTQRAYDKRGQLIRAVTETDTDLDGTMDERGWGSGEYNDAGIITKWVSQTVSIASGQVSTCTNWTAFDRRGQLTNTVSYMDDYGDGIVDTISSTAYQYDHKGNIVELQQETHSAYFADTMTETRTYDQHGDIVLSVYESKSGARPLTTIWTSWTYGSGGRLSSRVMRVDADGDGSPDPGRLETTFHCAPSGLPSWAYSRTLDADGRVVSSSTESFTYDQHRNMIRYREGLDDDGDGTVDRVFETNLGYIHR